MPEKPWPPERTVSTAIVHRDIVPINEKLANARRAFRIVGLEIGERLVGQHHAPAERVVRPVALDDHDLVRGIPPLQRNREVEPAGAAAKTNRAHEPIRSLCRTIIITYNF